MKKSLPYEIIAVLLAIFGVLLLVSVYMPLINPVQTKLDTHKDLPPLSYYFIFTPIPLAVLLASWYFNQKARRLKKEGENSQGKHGVY